MGRFNRTRPVPNVSGTGYRRFRNNVRNDFEECCAYCYLHEDHVGGQDHFDSDHFRPKKQFPHQINDFYNLYWCCKACNMHKHGDWPSKAILDAGMGYVDLCEDRFEDHYLILPDGELKPLTKKAAYTIRQTNLNKEHLKRLRVRLRQQNQRMDAPFAMPLPPDV